ncbi:hypothetical protein, partial [Klebsiella aerogenes]|uniref:hypothetical protein n=1 Tax=Klebsiella aerogenes TaxID=548 RepID=UPI001953226F
DLMSSIALAMGSGMSISNFTDHDMVILADAKELASWLWSVRYATSALFIVLLPGSPPFLNPVLE